MTPLARLIGPFCPACGLPAAQGVPVPPPLDPSRIVRPDTPNTALAAPEGFDPPPDITAPPYPVPPDRLFAAIQAVAAEQPRTFPVAIDPGRRQAHYVVRSAVFNFPDVVTVHAIPVAPDSSGLIIYSRSVYGHADLGVNRRRVQTWMAALRNQITPASER